MSVRTGDSLGAENAGRRKKEHTKDDGGCLRIRPVPRYYRYLQAFMFAIDEINNNTNILPNVTLGYHATDSCRNANKAIESVLSILSGHRLLIPNYSCWDTNKLAGVIGDQSSETSLHIAPILNMYGYPQVPVSTCSEECPLGFRSVMKKGIHRCCFECLPCSLGEISNETDKGSCHKCPEDQWPNDMNKCEPKPVEYLSYGNDTITLLISIITVILFIKTSSILAIFIVFRDTPLVRANNQNLSFILLVSIMLSFICVFLFLGHPVHTTCMLRQTSFAVIFSVAISSVLAKTIMVYSAFKATKPGSLWRRFIGFKITNCVVLFCSFIQVLISVIWLSVAPPFPESNTHLYVDKIIILCNEGSVVAFSLLLSYMGLLAAVTFIMAFLARNLPDSFNEAKYITFSMLVFCSVWITFIPTYTSVEGKNTVLVEIFAIISSSFGILGCIFFPKCYIILVRPDLNSKSNVLKQAHSRQPVPRYYRYLLAFVFAIKEINRNSDILPNVTLGYHATDSCRHVVKAMESILCILSGQRYPVPNYSCQNHSNLVGVIGDQSSETSLHIAQLLNMYGYAQISYGATDPFLTNKQFYPSFFKTLPSDQTQYLAITKLLKHFGWTWIGVITSDDDAGEKQIQELRKQTADHGICIEYTISLPAGSNVYMF
ncbi:vomeronasal type-2 receptor 26-like [Pyxicephalus adspersus]|uniref:vomeronasal type-2 receptor 26-like n=1 Tax=Pyxicephalus adspersus TaxID=30357 RepID=UPI003B5A4331